MLQTDKNCKSF